MARIVSFDLDKALAKGRIITEEAPNLLQMAEALGWAGASKVNGFLPMAEPLMKALGRLMGDGADGLSGAQLPETGPRGKGRLHYLLNKSAYDDASVVKAAELITTSGLPAAKSIVDQVHLICRAMFPGTPKGQWDDAQTRAAIDHILMEDGLPEGTCDKMGDLIHYALNLPPKGG